MSKIDDMIREALKCEERDILKSDGEIGFFALGLKQFRGPNGWVTWVLMITQSIFFIIGVYCMIMLFAAVEALSALKWGLVGSTSLIIGLQIKLALAPQMQADRVIRELTRIELMLSTEKS